jgi:hypothetical protein
MPNDRVRYPVTTHRKRSLDIWIYDTARYEIYYRLESEHSFFQRTHNQIKLLSI